MDIFPPCVLYSPQNHILDVFTLIIRPLDKEYKLHPSALNKHHAMKAYWGSEIIAPLIL
jgi:hypothetical protein